MKKKTVPIPIRSIRKQLTELETLGSRMRAAFEIIPPVPDPLLSFDGEKWVKAWRSWKRAKKRFERLAERHGALARRLAEALGENLEEGNCESK